MNCYKFALDKEKDTPVKQNRAHFVTCAILETHKDQVRGMKEADEEAMSESSLWKTDT